MSQKLTRELNHSYHKMTYLIKGIALIILGLFKIALTLLLVVLLVFATGILVEVGLAPIMKGIKSCCMTYRSVDYKDKDSTWAQYFPKRWQWKDSNQ